MADTERSAGEMALILLAGVAYGLGGAGWLYLQHQRRMAGLEKPASLNPPPSAQVLPGVLDELRRRVREGQDAIPALAEAYHLLGTLQGTALQLQLRRPDILKTYDRLNALAETLRAETSTAQPPVKRAR